MAPLTPRVFDSKGPEDSALDRDGFVGVDPIYQNAANETDKPLSGEGDGVRAAENSGVEGAADNPVQTTSDKAKEEDEKGDVENATASSKAAGTSDQTAEEKAEANAAKLLEDDDDSGDGKARKSASRR